MSCVDDLPNIGINELNYSCATELASMGPVAALLTIIIGIPVINISDFTGFPEIDFSPYQTARVGVV